MESKMLRAIRSVKTSFFFVLLLLFFFLVQNQMRSFVKGGTAIVPLPAQYLGLSVRPEVVKRFLGLRLLMADLVWIDTLIKADVTHEEMPYTQVYHAFDTMTDLDPANLWATYIAGLYLSVIKDDIEGATKLLRKGNARLKDMPSGWRGWDQVWKLPFMLGFNLMFEEHNFEEGAEVLRDLKYYRDLPLYARHITEHAATEKGALEIGGRILSDELENTTDESVRQRIKEKMTLVAAKSELLRLNEDFEKYVLRTDSKKLNQQIVLKRFLRWIGHSGRDLLGRPLTVDHWKIVIAKK